MKPIPDFPGYFVNEDRGDVLSFRYKRPEVLSPTVCGQGYLQVGLRQNGKRIFRMVHRLVALVALGPCPYGKQVNHRNGNKKDNRAANLEYVTPSENMRHAIEMGLIPYLPRGDVCIHGHPLDGLRTRPSGGRYCKTCVKLNKRRYRSLVRP
jgi:hypothetical protein